jgi:lysophospholipase L1-like esterase
MFYDNIKRLGRTYVGGDSLWCVHSGTGAAFEMTGESLSITFVGMKTAEQGNDKNKPRIGVFIDGERTEDFILSEAEKTLDFTLEPGTHNVRIIKLSEAAYSVFGITDIKCDGLVPEKSGELLIEFIGDSVTCAYGVDAEDINTPFSTGTEDFTKGFAYLTTAMTGADYSTVCFSGHGVITGYTTNGKKISEQIVPRFYGVLGASPDGMTVDTASLYADTIPWEYTNEPDLIVVCLGANDSSYTRGDPDKEREFMKGYIDFLFEIRAKNPNSAILCTLGVLGEGLFPAVEAAVREYSGKTGDNNVFTLEFDRQVPEDGYGSDWHPSAATHKKMAEKLSAWIDENLKKT